MTWSFPMDEDGGFIVIDKPKGPTSHQIDYWVREITGIAKVGHVGTLDPQATGVLAMALGKATRLIDIAHVNTECPDVCSRFTLYPEKNISTGKFQEFQLVYFSGS